MQEQVNHQKFVAGTLGDLVHSLTDTTDDAHRAIASATGLSNSADLEQHRQALVSQFSELAEKAKAEPAQPYEQYISRFDGVGVFQSVLAKLFQDFPDLQGYGDKNASWLATPIEQVFHFFKGFFSAVHQNVNGKHESLLEAVIKSWNEVKLNRAPYPDGVPQVITFADRDTTIALLADWGGDNPAARAVAQVVRNARPDITIHLGDIYYGGTKQECEAFLRLWPLQVDFDNPGKAIPAGSSYALNGNHEMYTGGESYFNVVLPAFGQPQPFFCLENKYWRLIGLDTAYAGGSLTMEGPESAGISRQWDWLVSLLKLNDGRANILLTHHQPVSAHQAEYHDSLTLRNDIAALIEKEGISKDAIFGWFFGHEHRAAIYDDTKTDYNARLIGSGCIPHLRQTETECDAGCTPFVGVNSRGEWGTQSAISMYAQLTFIGPFLEIVYVDEDNNSWGQEQWNAEKGRLAGVPFTASKSTFTS